MAAGYKTGSLVDGYMIIETVEIPANELEVTRLIDEWLVDLDREYPPELIDLALERLQWLRPQRRKAEAEEAAAQNHRLAAFKAATPRW